MAAVDVCRSRALPGTEPATPAERFKRLITPASSSTSSRSPSVDPRNETLMALQRSSSTPSTESPDTLTELDGPFDDPVGGDGIDIGGPSEELEGDGDNGEESGDESSDESHDEEDYRDLFADWDNGEKITATERQALLALGSDYERLRAMNIRRRERFEVESGLRDTVTDILSEIKMSVPDGTKPAKNPAKTSTADSAVQPRRSSRRSE